jgi:hypothetical protein
MQMMEVTNTREGRPDAAKQSETESIAVLAPQQILPRPSQTLLVTRQRLRFTFNGRTLHAKN